MPETVGSISAPSSRCFDFSEDLLEPFARSLTPPNIGNKLLTARNASKLTPSQPPFGLVVIT